MSVVIIDSKMHHSKPRNTREEGSGYNPNETEPYVWEPKKIGTEIKWIELYKMENIDQSLINLSKNFVKYDDIVNYMKNIELHMTKVT